MNFTFSEGNWKKILRYYLLQGILLLVRISGSNLDIGGISQVSI